VTVLVGLGVGPMQDAGLDRVVAAGPVEVPVVRRVVGLVTATGFLVLAGWLVRTGHWSRVDEEDWPE